MGLFFLQFRNTLKLLDIFNHVFLRNLVQILATAFLYFLSILVTGINFAVENEYFPSRMRSLLFLKIE